MFCSGAGKSTLFKLLLGKISLQKVIKFVDQSGQIIPFSKAKIGYLPQDPIVFPVLLKNITMFNQKLVTRLQSVVSGVQFATGIAKMPAGLDTVIDLKNENISGGQRQKIVLARSEIYNQPFVLMDEVTSAIDQAATEKIIENC
ncbi:hypothetical protein AO203_11980 (plasmid) [Lactobacillus gallinarum]|nr:hypothetical protein AO203_11980 [Lactobacillus gallinarum]